MTPVGTGRNHIINSSEIIPLLARYQMLPQLYRELIIDSAIADIKLTPQEEATALQQFGEKHSLSTKALREAWLQQKGITDDQLETIATRDYRIEKFILATWGNKIEPYFLTYKTQLDQVIYSLIRTQNIEIAQELFFRIQADEQTFASCAQKYSQGSEAQTGGLIGPVNLTQLHPVIAQKLASSQIGQLLPPMHLENWIVIVRLEKLIPAQLDDTMRSSILNHLFETWLAEQMSNIQLTLIDNTSKPTPVLLN